MPTKVKTKKKKAKGGKTKKSKTVLDFMGKPGKKTKAKKVKAKTKAKPAGKTKRRRRELFNFNYNKSDRKVLDAKTAKIAKATKKRVTPSDYVRAAIKYWVPKKSDKIQVGY